MNDRLDLTKATNGVYVLSSFTGKPEGDYGVLEEMGLNLPPTNSIIYYTAFQRHDPVRQAREDEVIGGGANRVQGLRITRWDETIEGGLFAILKLTDGDWLVLLPITGEKAMSWLDPVDPQSVKLKIGTLGTAPVEGDLPVFAYFRAPDLYEACSGAWREALDHSLMRGFARLRNEKRYPIIFQYLGWCSWEQHKRQIDANILTDAARRINAHDLPIRFLLIDDGYHCHTGSDSPVKDQLVRLGPNPDTFPDGWGPILEQRREDGIRWFGLWENFNGYWQRIAADNQLGETVNSHLMEVPEGGLMPGSTLPDAIAWYEGLVNVACSGGFDFVKIDNQAKGLHNYQGTDNAVQATTFCARALERAATAQVDGLINCMAHGPVNSFNTCLSAVTRCSEDYKVNDAWRAKAHLHNSYQNMLWLGPTVWGDHDMFHSSDTFAGRMMAVSKAVSGGPIYLSDDPDDFNPDHVWPLCDADGRLFRPLAPAVPLPHSAIIDPFEQAEPYVVAAPLPNKAAAIVAYNLTEPTQPVSGTITLDDYGAASGFLDENDGVWEKPEEPLLLYDWYNQELSLLSEPWNFTLDSFEDRLLLLCPIQHGWGVIGRTDKYLAPAAVEVLHTSAERIVVGSVEPCEVSLWHKDRLRRVSLAKGNTVIESTELKN